MDHEREQSEMNAEDKPTEWTSVPVQIRVVPLEKLDENLYQYGARKTDCRYPNRRYSTIHWVKDK